MDDGTNLCENNVWKGSSFLLKLFRYKLISCDKVLIMRVVSNGAPEHYQRTYFENAAVRWIANLNVALNAASD